MQDRIWRCCDNQPRADHTAKLKFQFRAQQIETLKSFFIRKLCSVQPKVVFRWFWLFSDYLLLLCITKSRWQKKERFSYKIIDKFTLSGRSSLLLLHFAGWCGAVLYIYNEDSRSGNIHWDKFMFRCSHLNELTHCDKRERKTKRIKFISLPFATCLSLTLSATKNLLTMHFAHKLLRKPNTVVAPHRIVIVRWHA